MEFLDFLKGAPPWLLYPVGAIVSFATAAGWFVGVRRDLAEWRKAEAELRSKVSDESPDDASRGGRGPKRRRGRALLFAVSVSVGILGWVLGYASARSVEGFRADARGEAMSQAPQTDDTKCRGFRDQFVRLTANLTDVKRKWPAGGRQRFERWFEQAREAGFVEPQIAEFEQQLPTIAKEAKWSGSSEQVALANDFYRSRNAILGSMCR